MKRLVDTKFVDALINNKLEHINSTEMKAIIEEFVDLAISICDSDVDCIFSFRTLNYTRIYLRTLQGESANRHRAKKKCRHPATEYCICFGNYRSGTSTTPESVGLPCIVHGK